MQGRRVDIEGSVGVGFRPWVYRLARRAGVAGRIRVNAASAMVEVFGSAGAVSYFVHELAMPPAGVFIRRLVWQTISAEEPVDEFATSAEPSLRTGLPDRGICESCLAEIEDPANRRHRDAFAMCSRCGPRFTIGVDDPAGDRASSSLAERPMCARCSEEASSPGDRRFGLSVLTCPACGPHLVLADAGGLPVAEGDSAIAAAVTALRSGLIVAVKGTGGFQFCCLASDGHAVAALRERKHTEKPFAVIAANVREMEKIAALSEEEKDLLESAERPIVICRRRPSALAGAVALRSASIGLVLPDSALLHMLVRDVGAPLVTTSGNRSTEPIAFRNEDALARLRWIADLFLLHDRPIASPCEESVTRIVAGKPLLVRRARGWVPRAIPIARSFLEPVLAVGGRQEEAVCIASGDAVFLAPPVTLPLGPFDETVERMTRMVGVVPAIVAHDLDLDHPATFWANERPNVRTFAVQQHHAHVVAAMAEHGLRGPVMGLAFDGGGRGTDGSWWGGELLFADDEECRRVATFRPLRLAGGPRAMREPWRIALAMLEDGFGQGVPEEIVRRLLPGIDGNEREAVRKMIARGEGTPATHSLLCWIEAMAAIGLRRVRCAFDGQLGEEWTGLADPLEHRAYPWTLDDSKMPWTIDLRAAVRVAVQELLHDRATGTVSAKFQNTIAAASIAVTQLALSEIGRVPVVLTGRCFENRRLAEAVLGELSEETAVFLPVQTAPGDDGIALGQAVIADALLRREREIVQALAEPDGSGSERTLQ